MSQLKIFSPGSIPKTKRKHKINAKLVRKILRRSIPILKLGRQSDRKNSLATALPLSQAGFKVSRKQQLMNLKQAQAQAGDIPTDNFHNTSIIFDFCLKGDKRSLAKFIVERDHSILVTLPFFRTKKFLIIIW